MLKEVLGSLQTRGNQVLNHDQCLLSRYVLGRLCVMGISYPFSFNLYLHDLEDRMCGGSAPFQIERLNSELNSRPPASDDRRRRTKQTCCELDDAYLYVFLSHFVRLQAAISYTTRAGIAHSVRSGGSPGVDWKLSTT